MIWALFWLGSAWRWLVSHLKTAFPPRNTTFVHKRQALPLSLSLSSLITLLKVSFQKVYSTSFSAVTFHQAPKHRQLSATIRAKPAPALTPKAATSSLHTTINIFSANPLFYLYKFIRLTLIHSPQGKHIPKI